MLPTPKLPNPPTDNLYKFIAIAGLLLFLVSPTYWLVLHSKAFPFIQAEHESSERAFDLANEISSVTAKAHGQWVLHNRGSFASMPYDRRTGESRLSDYLEDRMTRHLKYSLGEIEELTKKMDPLTRLYLKHQSLAGSMALGVMLFGAVLSVVGFRLWYVRIQKPLDHMLVMEVVKAEEKHAMSQDLEKEMD